MGTIKIVCKGCKGQFNIDSLVEVSTGKPNVVEVFCPECNRSLGIKTLVDAGMQYSDIDVPDDVSALESLPTAHDTAKLAKHHKGGSVSDTAVLDAPPKVAEKPAPLHARDRCDACWVASANRVWFRESDGRTIHLCMHHSRKHEPRLISEGYALHEYREEVCGCGCDAKATTG